MTSRSHFYVDTPRDPSQRHSMFVSHSELVQRQDLSSNSSSATLPSAAGSVDRLTGLEEKKSSRFFTLKPKTSFSLKPFFRSTSSLISQSPGKRRKAILERRDSGVQTEETRPVFGEVGVQTLNASTVDVPVQTCLQAWEEGDSYGLRRLTYATPRASPFWSRPSVSSSALSNSLFSKNVAKDPLASPKLIKYAAPGDSEKTALHHQSADSPVDVNSCQLQSSSHSVTSSSPSVPVKYFSAKELNSNIIPLTISPKSESAGQLQSLHSNESKESSSSVPLEKYENINESGLNSEKSKSTAPQEHTAKDKQTPEVSSSLKYSHITEPHISALKSETTGSPSKRNKFVHFDLSQSKPSENSTNTPLKPRNVDEDFEALLKDLNILTDDHDNLTTSCSTPVANEKNLSLNVIPPILPSFKSAFDCLKEDFLAPIPESLNECSENEPCKESTVNNSGKVSSDTKHDIEVDTSDLNSNPQILKQPLSRSISEYENQNSVEESKNGSVTPTSLSIFTSSNSGSNQETDCFQGNVYDSVIKEENSVKTVSLPTLPSFFESSLNPQTVQQTSEVVEFVESNSIGIPPDKQTLSDMPLETDFDRSRLSRSSSRSSVRSGSKLGLNSNHEPMSRFDSCENLDQLEEEIIRSLYSPDDGKLEEKIMKNIELPESETFQNSGTTATHMRRVILDQLLRGKSVEDIVPNLPEYKRANSVTETRENLKSPVKYSAVLTEVSPVNFGHSVSNDKRETNLSQFESPDIFSTVNVNTKKETNSFPIKKKTSSNENDSSKKTSTVFLFPENTISDNEGSKNPVLEISTPDNKKKVASLLEVRRSSWTPQTTSDAPMNDGKSKPSPSRENSVDNRSEQCDFTNCLRPSKIQNSPFLAKINARSMSPCNSSPLPYQNSSTVNNRSSPKKDDDHAKVPEALGECDFASCLKPSQVQNSLFTAKISEITAIKSGNSLRAGSPLTIRTHSPVTARSNSLDITKTTPVCTEEKKDAEKDTFEPIKHKSELQITLQTTAKLSSDTDSKSETSSNIENCENLIQASAEIPVTDQNSDEKSGSSESAKVEFTVPPPPPPPPPPSSAPKSHACAKEADSLVDNEVKHEDNESMTTKVSFESVTLKTPVITELELKLKDKNDFQRRSSNDQINEESPTSIDKSDDNTKAERSEIKLNGSPNSVSNGKQNGSIGGFSEKREHISTTPNDKYDHSYGKTKLTFSPDTIITDEPPPPGAVLLDKKITVDGDKVHTDKYFAIPVREVLKEKTTTTKFIPAPPKYDGIGPTEDGIPIGLRNSVKKENMHNWYKTMFKSLHKADSSNDSQEYIIGYTSEPESSTRDMMIRKKSSSLDNRIKQDTNNKSNNQNYPPSAKSSIEVYNVRPRLIEDYEPGYSSVTDNMTISKRYLPSSNTVKPSYEFKNGYESDSNITKKRDQPETLSSEQQKMWYREIQKGGEIPQFGLGKPSPEKPIDPSVGPVPPPPLNYSSQPSYQQAVRPLTLPANYSNGNGYCQQMNGAYEMQIRNAIHSEMQQRMSPSSNQLSPPNRGIMKSPCRSPEMRTPARALFDFKAESPKEIPLKKSDMVLILRQLDKNWYEGEKNGVIGIFPISYVEIIPPEHISPIKIQTEGFGKALYDFVAQTSIELTVRKGDSITLIRRVDANWYEGIFNGKKGIIPVSYIQVLQEPAERNMNSPSQKSYISSPIESKEKSSKTNSISPSNCSSTSISPLPVNLERRKSPIKKGSHLIEPVLYRALYSYNPQNSDELELQEGDNVYVVEMCDDGWYVGTSVRSGIFGIFPGNYVEKAAS